MFSEWCTRLSSSVICLFIPRCICRVEGIVDESKVKPWVRHDCLRGDADSIQFGVSDLIIKVCFSSCLQACWCGMVWYGVVWYGVPESRCDRRLALLL